MHLQGNSLHIILLAATVLWCVLHSILIAIPVTEFFRKYLGVNYRFYRIGYNIFSIISLIPVIALELSLKSEVIFNWDHPFLLFVRILLLVVSVLIFYLGSKQYDGGELLGLNQLKTGKHNRTLSTSGSLNTSGILNVIRHPFYLAGIIIIWLRPINLSVLLVNSVFTIYLIVGSVIEEGKLIKEFGSAYIEYKKRVSMLIPWKWLWSKLSGKIS